jgi:hypothetical protein
VAAEGTVGQVSGGDLLQEAIAELYSGDPGEFIERRSGLAARARTAGDAALAKKITGLRKPTRSAWILNQLVRSAPEVTSQLAELGDDLRAAQRSLDGPAIRELSLRRRQLIDALTRQAFALSGQQPPPPVLKDEVTATLNAALADPQFNEQLRAGALDRAVRRDGFGPAAAPGLVLLPSPSRGATARARAATGTAPPAAHAPPATARGAAKVKAGQKRHLQAIATAGQERRRATAAEREHRRAIAAAEQEQRRAIAAAEQEQEHHRAIAAAEQAVAEADQAADAAAVAERADDSAVRQIEEQLTEARRRLADTRLRTRQAGTRQRQARQALNQLQQHPPPAPGSQARR